jgi:hypothetical protein
MFVHFRLGKKCVKTQFFGNEQQWQGGKGSTMRWHVITRNYHVHSRADDTSIKFCFKFT